MDDPVTRVYYAGIRHIPKEGSFGPPVDVAAPLRGLCAQSLARMGYPDALLECVPLLADPEMPARAGAVRAIADAGRVEAVLLLRLKALLGDKEAEVTSECLSALLEPEPARAVEFVAKFLDSRLEGIGEQAALALGESPVPAAFQALREAWERAGTSKRRRTLLVAIAMIRSDDELEFLLGRLSAEGGPVAADALAGLSFYARDEAVRGRVRKILKERGDRVLVAVFAREFGLPGRIDT
jgi:HEAT repeat protein